MLELASIWKEVNRHIVSYVVDEAICRMNNFLRSIR